MRFLRRIKPEAPLRIGLAGTFIYSGLDLIRNPQGWEWALNKIVVQLPDSLQELITTVGPERFLQAHGVVELIFAIVLLAWFAPKGLLRFVSVFISLEMFIILLFVGIDSITFRDIGLLGGALSLILVSYRRSY